MREYFWKIRKFLNLAVLISFSKFLITSRLLNPSNASLWCICDGFLREKGLVHQKVDDARINVVDPLAVLLGSNTQIVSRYAQIPDKQKYLEEVGGIMKL